MRTPFALGLIALAASSAVLADARVPLGDAQRVTRLFAYPNNCGVICFRDWSLERTVEHYLTQSVQRDGYPTATVTVRREHDQLHADISGVPTTYAAPLKALLDSGELAYAGADRLNREGKWAYNWALFLPLGMALENRRSIELLHFPPDYSLTQAQDYLRSNTTDRWAQLLTFNGVPAQHTPAYQTIVDIAPIAAPASAGKDLEGVYGYFTDYQVRMVRDMTAAADGASLPMVAFGAPVRSWVQQQYGPEVKVLGAGEHQPGAWAQRAGAGRKSPERDLVRRRPEEQRQRPGQGRCGRFADDGAGLERGVLAGGNGAQPEGGCKCHAGGMHAKMAGEGEEADLRAVFPHGTPDDAGAGPCQVQYGGDDAGVTQPVGAGFAGEGRTTDR